MGTSQHDINHFVTSSGGLSGSNEQPKRTRSISRSVRNLFGGNKGKREQSYDSTNGYIVGGGSNNNEYDVNSDIAGMPKSKSIGRSIKKMFSMSKNNRDSPGSNASNQRTESVGPGGSGRYTTQLTPQRQYDSNKSINAPEEPMPHQRSNSMLLKRDYRAP